MVQTALRASDVIEPRDAVAQVGGRRRLDWRRGLAYAAVIAVGGMLGVLMGTFAALALGLLTIAC